MSGKFVVGLNSHGEITSLLFPGKVCLEKHHIMSCVSKAFSNAKAFAEKVMSLVEEDIEKRKTSVKTDGFLNVLKSDSEYNKSLLLERIQGIRTTNKPDEEFAEEQPLEIKEKITGEEEDKDKDKDTDKDEDISWDSDSDEEFSADLLHKNLDEIRAEKKAKGELKSKTKQSSNASLDDDEMEVQSTPLVKNDIF